MNSLQRIIIATGIIVLLFSCQKGEIIEDNNLQDIIASQGMSLSFYGANMYNDSLVYCSDSSNMCDTLSITRYDSLFHKYENDFEMFHESYSHSNRFDDHHNQDMSQHRNDNHIHGDDNSHISWMHGRIEHTEMLDLIKYHNSYHPK